MKKIRIMLALVFCFSVTMPVHALFGKKEEEKKTEEKIEVPPLKGPKKILAVKEFENKAESSPEDWWHGQKLGQGMSDMLVTSLMDSNYFIVLERESLQDGILAEQDLAASGRTTKEGHAKIGKVLQAQALIQGAVTIFEEGTKGGSKGGAIQIRNVSLGLGGGSGESQVGVDIRIYDTATSQVLAAKNCKGFAKSKRGGLSFGLTGTSGGVPGAFSFGGDKMEKSPLGDATRDAITGCMLFIIEELNKVPWSGRVMKVENGQVYINCGTRNNINIGDQFKIFKLGEAFTDPDTGESLGSEESEIGSIRVVKTQEKFSICSAVSGQAEQFAKDNVIRWNG